uniref:transcriptional regulator n=1 Tax=Parabacteroides distasonis TaxID=823 RepID=UPI0022DEFF9F
MPELISIEEAARITGFPYEEIEDWVKSRKITSFHTRTGTRMVDTENLRDFIAHIEHLGIQKLYLQLVIQDKEEEADEIIAQYDDYLFCLRSLKNISPLLKQIIAELSTFIDDKQDRYIFTEITSGAKILDVAKRISLPVTSLTLSPYIRKCLQKLELETMEDLLRYARKKGLDSLLKISGFGPLGLDQLKFQLEKHKIMNKAGDGSPDKSGGKFFNSIENL